jgi:hypothetical protein
MGQVTDGLRALLEQLRESEIRSQARLDAYAERTEKRLKKLKKLSEEE